MVYLTSYTNEKYLGVFTGGGVISGVLTQSGRFFCRFLDFRPEVGMDFAQKLVPPYFGHAEFKNQGFVAQRNSGGAIRGPEHGQFSGNLLLLVWHTYRVFTVLGPVLKRIVTKYCRENHQKLLAA